MVEKYDGIVDINVDGADDLLNAEISEENFAEDTGDLMDIIIMPYTEMATVGRDLNNNFAVIVTPDTGRNDAYIKVCDHQSYHSSRQIIRLSFKEVKYFDHSGDGKTLWKINIKEKKALTEFLRSKPKRKDSQFNTNWELAIFLWNNECGFTDHPDYDENIPEGCKSDSVLLKNPQYVKLNQEMPDYTKLCF